MKQMLYTIICLVVAASLAACGGNSTKSTGVVNQQAGVADVLQQGMAAADQKAAAEDPSPETQIMSTATMLPPTPEVALEDIEASNEAEGIDIDLTKLSSTMVYAEVFSMMTNAKEYVGKTIRMRGNFSYYHNKPTDTYYFACLIKDATACCAQGIEFVLGGDLQFPEDYPRPGDEITVTGVFEPYLENDYTFYHLTNAVYSE